MARAWRQQSNARVAALAALGQRTLHILKMTGEPEHIAGLEKIFGNVAVDDAIGERVADARLRFCMVVDHPPLTIARTSKIGRIKLQGTIVGHDALARLQE